MQEGNAQLRSSCYYNPYTESSSSMSPLSPTSGAQTSNYDDPIVSIASKGSHDGKFSPFFSGEITNTTGIVESKMMPTMRSTPTLDEHECDILEIFYSNARIRIQQIFGSNPNRHRLLHTIRGSNQQDRTDTSYLDGTISTFESLFQDILDDIQVCTYVFPCQ